MTSDEIRNPKLARKWHRYYRIDEVHRHLHQVDKQINEERKELSALRVLNETLNREHVEWTKTYALQEQTISEQFREIGELGEQLAQCYIENAQQHEQVTRQTDEIARLQAHITALTERVAKLECQNADAIIEEAVQEARTIVNKAVADRDRLRLKTTEQREHLLAACRDAYSSALQFKKDLAERFMHMEQELNTSIDILQSMVNSRILLDLIDIQNSNETGNYDSPS